MAWHQLSRASAPLAPVVASLGSGAWSRKRSQGSDHETLAPSTEPMKVGDSSPFPQHYSSKSFKNVFDRRAPRSVPSMYVECKGLDNVARVPSYATHQLVLPLKREDIIKANNKGSFTDQYETGRPLGEGSFGSVSLCTNKSSGEKFAVKMIATSSVADYEAFINEVKMMMDLDHPHIIRLIEYFEEDDHVKLVMELCTGMDMFDKTVSVMEADGHFSAQATAFAMRQMIKGVIGCHSHNIIHKDLKPENFMIKDAKKEEKEGFLHASIRLIDLGLAEQYADGVKSTAAMSGSVPYTAPEVFAGSYDEKCDVWSLGCIMYVMITGEPLFPLGEPAEEVTEMIQEENYVFQALQQVKDQPWITDEAMDLMEKMLEYDPSRRISLKEAAKHPYITGARDGKKDAERQKSGILYDSEVSQKLQAFAEMPALKRGALLIMSHLASDSSTTLQRRTFRAMDVDFDGQLSKKEMENWLKSNNIPLPAMWDIAFEQIDVDGSGHIQYCEFLAATLPSSFYLQEHMMAQAFATLEGGGSRDGSIDEDDLLALTQNRMPRKAIRQIIAEASPEGKLKLTYDDFKKMMHQGNTVFQAAPSSSLKGTKPWWSALAVTAVSVAVAAAVAGKPALQG